MNRKELKDISKNQLKGHWKVPVLLTLMYIAVTFAISMVQNFLYSEAVVFLCLVSSIIIEVVAVVGFPKFYLKFIQNNDDINFRDFFASKGVLFKSLGFVMLMYLIGVVVGIIIGFALISSISYSMLGYATFTGSVWLLILLVLVLSILITIFSLYIAMTTYILVDKEGSKVFEAMGLSIKMMKGYKWELFVLYLSFIGWGILCILTLGIGYLWLAPYMSLTVSNFYKELDKKYNYQVDLSKY